MTGTRRFPCTPGGVAAAGRRRLAQLFLALGSVLAAGAAWAFWSGRVWPGVFALLAIWLPLSAWRMASDAMPLWLELRQDDLRLQLRGGVRDLGRAALAARRLSADEIEHLTRLAERAGIVAASGGFDSHRLGELELFASDLAHAVLLESGEDRLVVTPDDPDLLLAALTAPQRVTESA